MADIDVAATGTAPLVHGFPGVDGACRAERLAKRAALKIADVEKAVILICAEIVGIVPGRELFIDEWPLRQETAYSFRIEKEKESSSPDGREFVGRFAGRSRDREEVMRSFAALAGALPGTWITADSGEFDTPVTIARVVLEGAPSFGRSSGEGRRFFTGEAHLAIRVCTTLPRSCGSGLN